MTKSAKKSTKKSVAKSTKKSVAKSKEDLSKYIGMDVHSSVLKEFVAKASVEDIVEVVMARTKHWGELYGVIETKKKDRDPKAVKIEKMFEKGEVEFGCKTDRALGLFSILLGEPIGKRKQGSVDLVPLLGVAMIDNPNSHDYGKEKPFVTYKSGYSSQMKSSGSLGNNLPSELSAYRVATEAEVTKFFEDRLETFRKVIR